MKKVIHYFEQRPILGYIIYFIAWYFILVLANWEFFNDKTNAFATYLKKITAMVLGAYIFIRWLVPLLNKKNYTLFTICFFVLMAVLQVYSTAVDVYLLDHLFPEEAKAYIKRNGVVPFWKRALNPMGILVRTPMFYMFPTLLLYVFRYMREQQRIAKMNEQKKIAELKALKGQLNPHFLFNTLNNIYSLTLLKNEQAPEVVSKLSDMLDYMIYKCDCRFVPLKNEIQLLEDYIQLEKVRYGKRVNISFDREINADVQIAPLILLTFLENAFKHGVSEELSVATIQLNIVADKEFILTTITNTVPSQNKKQASDKIGLDNVQKQLELIYPNEHNLQIQQEENQFSVTLKVASK